VSDAAFRDLFKETDAERAGRERREAEAAVQAHVPDEPDSRTDEPYFEADDLPFAEGVALPPPAQAADRVRRAVATPASRIHREQVEWLEPGRIPLRMVTVLAGIGGLGKSQLACLYAASNRGVTLIATAEDSPSTTVRPRLEAVQADLERVRFVSIKTSEGIEDGIAIPDDMEELERLVAEAEARLVVVDPLVAHLPMHIDSHKDQSVRRALAPLYRLAEAHNCAVLALLHLNKATGLAPLMRLGGSGAFGNAARSVLLLDRDPDDPDGEEGNRRVLAHIKCNVAPLAPSFVYEVKPILLPATDSDPEVETSRLELIGESPHNGRALLATASEEERTALDEAVEFLLAELGDGERHNAGEITKAAARIGINYRTLRRARKAVGAGSEKEGFGGDGAWKWWLPKGTSLPGEPAFLHVGDSLPEVSPSLSSSPNGRHPVLGDELYPAVLAEAVRNEQIAPGEAEQALAVHKYVVRARSVA
jgi:AAA domain